MHTLWWGWQQSRYVCAMSAVVGTDEGRLSMVVECISLLHLGLDFAEFLLPSSPLLSSPLSPVPVLSTLPSPSPLLFGMAMAFEWAHPGIALDAPVA